MVFSEENKASPQPFITGRGISGRQEAGLMLSRFQSHKVLEEAPVRVTKMLIGLESIAQMIRLRRLVYIH